MPEQLIVVEPVEEDLSPERIDERLAAGFFPWGQRWMTCRAWPMDEGPRDTIWVRVRLARRPASDRRRRLSREGATAVLCPQPVFDDEHQELYDRFRASRHPDWTPEAAHLLIEGEESPLLSYTREIAVRDGAGKLVAYRWFVEGKTAVAGLSSIYDTTRSGLGTIARALADEWAHDSGFTWSYPGYVWPGASDPWYYKIKPGRTEWLDPETKAWRPWDGDEPRAEDLALAQMRERLGALGEVIHNPGWAIPCVDPTSRGLSAPYFVAGSRHADELTVFVWNLTHRWYEEFRVVVQDAGDRTTSGRPVGPSE